MRAFGFGEGFEPVRDFIEAFFAGGAGHAGIHVGVFMGFPGDGGGEVVGGFADGQAGGRIADFFEEFQMAVRVAGFPFRCGAEDGSNVVKAFNIGFLGEIQIAAMASS